MIESDTSILSCLVITLEVEISAAYIMSKLSREDITIISTPSGSQEVDNG